MQEKVFFKYLTWVFRVVLVFCFLIAVIQNYITDGKVVLFGYELNQFYPHIEVRILPLLWVSFFLVPKIKRVLDLKNNFYLSEAIISLLLAVDAFTHTNGIYSESTGIYLFGDELWFDKAMHFFEGLVLTVTIYPMLKRFTNLKFSSSKLWALWMTLGFTSIFYISWEIIEYVIDGFLGEKLLVTGWYDTNQDLALAYLGSFIGWCLIEIYKFFGVRFNKK